MITVEEAEHILNTHPGTWGTEPIPLTHAAGRVLAEPVYADRDLPPFPRATMDGIAINYTDWNAGIKEYNIIGTQAAGMPPLSLSVAGDAVEIMTGATLPHNATTVVPYESLTLNGNKATVVAETVHNAKNIHPQGIDAIAGALLLNANTIIDPATIGVLASVGKATLLVKQIPKIAIIATGNELIPVDEQPNKYQIRLSNSYSLHSLLAQAGCQADTFTLADDEQLLTRQIDHITTQYPVVITTGGISKGKYDYLPEILQKLNTKILFHGIAQRPGKPFLLGMRGSTMLFALPGNPVSCFMCTLRYVMPWLYHSYGITTQRYIYGALTQDIEFLPQLTYFAQVAINIDKSGTVNATPILGNGSGDYLNLLSVSGFAELPAHTSLFPKGNIYKLWLFKRLILKYE